MKKKIKFELLALCILLGLSIVSCNGKKKGVITEEEKPTLDTIISPVDSKESVKRLTIYLESSGSMKGFVNFPNGATIASGFKRIVSEFSSYASKAYGETQVVCKSIVSGQIPRHSFKNSAEFNSKIISGSIFTGQDTPLDKMLSVIIDSCSRRDEVAILISDCILSFPASDVRRDSMINVKNSSILEAAVRDALIKYRKKNMTMALVKYVSEFNGGYYYNCKNKKNPLLTKQIMKSRPFYFCVIGRSDLVSQVINNKVLWPKGGEVFMLMDTITTEIGVFAKEKAFNAIVQGKQKISIPASKSVRPEKQVFYVGLKITGLPDVYLPIKNAIAGSIKTSSTLVAGIKRVNKTDLKIKNMSKASDPLRYDYFFEVQVVNESSELQQLNRVNYSQLEFYLEPRYTLNVDSISIMDDYSLGFEGLEGKSWGLKLLTNAIITAKYGPSEPILSKVSIQIKRN